MVWCHIYHQSYLRLWGYEITRVNIDHDQGADCRPYQLMVLKSLLRVAYKWSSLHVILSKGPIKTALGLPVHAKLLPNILSYPQENNPKNGYAFHLWHISPPLLLLNFPFSWQSGIMFKIASGRRCFSGTSGSLFLLKLLPWNSLLR